jgi:hypothetical protein
LDELRSLAQLSSPDLAALKRGQVIVERRPNGDFLRGVSLESCYFLHAPMSAVGETLLHWNPVPHKELDIHHYGEFSIPPAPDALKALQLNPGAPDDRWLLNQTAEVGRGSAPTELHLTNQETELLRQRSANPSAAWQQILRGRAEALARGGLSAVAPYGADNSISPASEFRGLLTLAPKAARHFQPVTKAINGSGPPASEAVGYWEMAKVRDHTTLQLGVFAAQKSANSWQLVNCMYYPSDTYFMALDFFQLWPVDDGTLVWQVGFVSAPFRSYLGGVDRYVAGKQMIQETIETVKAFRDDVERRR